MSKEGVRPNPDNVEKLKQMPVPKNVTQVRQVLGLASYYRRFLKDFSGVAKPLIELTRKNVPFKWTEACENAFQSLKEILSSDAIMAYPKDEGEFILDVDASDHGIGAVLSQIQDQQEKVIAYGSRILNKAERNYCVTDKELLALRYFVEYYRQYLLGRKFRVRSDHQALKWLFSLKEPKGRVARWIEILSPFDFSVEYRPGRKHQNADSMSRLCFSPRDCQCSEADMSEPLKCGPCKKCFKRMVEMESTLSTVDSCRVVQTRAKSGSLPSENIFVWEGWTNFETHNKSLLRKKQEEDEDISLVLESKKNGKKPDYSVIAISSPATRHYFNFWDSLELHEGLLFKRFYKQDGTGNFLQFLVPRSMKREVMFQMHNNLLSGHLRSKEI